jgi:histidyl-tRNA synthetase
MKYANQRAIPIVVIAGESEVAEQRFTVKWMKEGTQETVDANKLVETII